MQTKAHNIKQTRTQTKQNQNTRQQTNKIKENTIDNDEQHKPQHNTNNR